MPSVGPLGNVAGMFYDPIRGKYFPIGSGQPARPTASPLASQPSTSRISIDEPITRSEQPRKRQKGELTQRDAVCAFTKAFLGGEAGSSRAPGQRSRERKLRSRLVPGEQSIWSKRARTQVNYYANMELEHTSELVSTPCERITSLTTYPDGSLFSTTDHGRVVMKRQDHCTNEYAACGSPLLGVHVNMPRNAILSVSSGPQPHIHRGRFDVDDLGHTSQDDGIDLPVQDAYCMSSHGDLLTIGCNRRIICINSSANSMKPWHASRRLQSDVLAIHHAEEQIVYAGLRNSEIVTTDFRADNRNKACHIIGQSKRRKAIVGVRRLKDSAVPFGLVASGMANELLLFDVRFGKEPLMTLPGHVNTWFGNLGLATTFDDSILFAAGSDCRVRAWNLLDGSRVLPSDTNPALLSEDSSNPLTRKFEDRPSAIQITESGLLDVAVARHVYRFSRPTIVTHHPMTAEPA